MARLPHPPSVDAVRGSRPAWREIPSGTLLWRIFPRTGRYPGSWNRFRTWGPSASRFDPHQPDALGRSHEQTRGVLYVATESPTCFAEYFQGTRTIDCARDLVTLTGFRIGRPLRVLNLWDAWATRLGASGALSSGRHDITRAWARTLYEAFPDADGLRYESVMHPEHAALALFERAGDALPDAPHFHRALADPDLGPMIHNAARRFGFEIG